MAKEKLTASEKRSGWRRFIRFLILIILTILIGGFFVFAYRVENTRPPEIIPRADGIVVLTGKGGNRLEAAARLLEQNKGERLLISGVNQKTTLEAIRSAVNLSDSLAHCCVDLDYIAEDTVGNAKETASWAKALGYEHIILVTSDYHMPRAEIEIGAKAGRIRITPYPVSSADNRKWWSNGARFKGLAMEYGKLLLSYIRQPSKRSHRTPPPLELKVDEPGTIDE